MANPAQSIHYVRERMTESLPPPASETGIIGWIRQNLVSSWSNTILTLIGLYLIWIIVPAVYQFLIGDAVWTGETREDCLGHHAACWPYVKAKFDQFIYGRYPFDERWRVDLVFLMGTIGLIPMAIPSIPYKAANAFFLLLAFPIASFVLLTGGHVDFSAWFWISLVAIWAIVSAVMVGVVWAGGNPWNKAQDQLTLWSAVVACIIAICVVISLDFGLAPVETPLWGGLLVTLVVAVTGIAASLPLGILLALGRRSDMPIVRIFSIIFIEFWRGVPLITVLFMSSVLLPLFLPEGVTFDKLLRALIGVALFASAYMAETVRGGLQAIPRGQYEGAQALGLSYWRMMALIILPQALKMVIPGIVNTFIGLFKDTTLVLIIGLFDMLGMIQLSFTDPNWSTPFTSHTGYAFAALVYWVFCFSMSRYSIFMENRLHTGHRR